MHSYNTISDFENWNPHIQSLADRLLIGPQRELLEKVQRLNNRYNLGINVTRTYRWSPGYMDKIKDYMVNRYIQVGMKRKISTFFNQIDEKEWHYNALKRDLNQIDDIMANKRRIRAVFQDNSDLIADRWEIFYEIIVRESKKVKETMDHINFDVEIVRDEANNDAISFTWAFPEMDMNIFVGNNYFPIEMGKVEVNVIFTIDELVMNLCNDGACQFGDDADGNPVVSLLNLANSNSYSKFGGWYEPKYIGGNTALYHPFITSYNSYSREIDGNGFKNTCLGDLTGRAWSDMCSLNLMGVTLTLMQWLTTFNARDTRPLNNIRQAYWGLPERVNHPDFLGVYGMSPSECKMPDHEEAYEEQSTYYCKTVNCALKERCHFFRTIEGIEDGGELADQDGEVIRDAQGTIVEFSVGQFDPEAIAEQVPEAIDSEREVELVNRVNRELGLTNDGEELHHENPNDNGLGGDMPRDYREEMDNIHASEGIDTIPLDPMTEEQIQEDLLEQLLRQQYRVIDIGRE